MSEASLNKACLDEAISQDLFNSTMVTLLVGFFIVTVTFLAFWCK